LLNAVTIIFTRRKINIESINVSETEVEGVSRYTIVIETTREQAEKVVKRIRKLIDVFWAFVYENDEIFYQEIALYKVPTKAFLNGDNAEYLVRNSGARILVIEEDFIIKLSRPQPSYITWAIRAASTTSPTTESIRQIAVNRRPSARRNGNRG
jgi:acetolactate synthase-1/3 small subunit